ncbi:hypothetical protein SGFS_038200 [Streptomyces graminofaciens]|uniref:WXG100 family type VII secretion target n=1 Tax=Streptomyces graminofaciens TaxID=68212 RepID=A0ABN5VHR9_9ACTN|nr:hypothetical protein [Streptomyces graminofaciens]BBC32526.1 hypothetical protein SGFS_038200 [Streptomyces graminofaciens]
MLNYQTLIEANFSELSEAVARWKKLPESFKTVSGRYASTVEKDLEGSDWEGEAATAAVKQLKQVEQQINSAADEAQDIFKLLDNAHEIFTQAQSKLKSLKHDIESDKYLSIKPTGEVYFDPPEDTPTEHIAALNKGYQETLQAYRASIQGHLAAAQEADEALHWALNQDHNGRESGFDSDYYHSIADAKKGREQAEKDLKELKKLTDSKSELALAGAYDSVDPATLRRIDTLLKRHEGDPYFTEKFATGLGGKGTIELWTRIADRQQTGGEQTKASAAIQKSLSYTLATASHSDSSAMEKWKKDVIALGDKQVEYTAWGTATEQKGPYGFQVMSSLMHYGTYDKDFLNDYGHELFSYEKSHKEKPEDLWRAENDEFPNLNFGPGSDYGQDPVSGYMEALGHNPEAAKELFYSKGWDADDKVDPDLKYLMSDREWPNANPFAKNNRGYGYDELGHALEAATLGIPYDQPGLGLNRDNTTANIMEQVTRIVSGEEGFIKDKPGIGNSLAKMGAGYIDDLDWSMSNFGDTQDGQARRDDAFNHRGDGHINLAHNTALGFLSELGTYAGSYEIISAAQQEYTIGALKSHPEPNESLALAIETGSKVHGALDQARLTDINSTYKQGTDDYSDALADACEWKKHGVSQLIGTGVALAVLPFGGPAAATGAAAVAQFVVPTLIESGGATLETSMGLDIDQQVRDQEDAYNDKMDKEEAMTKDKFAALGYSRVTSPLEAYIAVHPELEDSAWHNSVKQRVQSGYVWGDTESDQVDVD